MPSDCSQDKFVLDTLKNKKNGYWVEVGCQGPFKSSNTHILEMDYGWQGISIDINPMYISMWAGVRKTDKLLCCNALNIDYKKLFEHYGAPEIIDYLSMDLEPPPITFEALKLIPFNKYKFRVITFEHDSYRKEYDSFDLVNKSIELLEGFGYSRISKDICNAFSRDISLAEDWYVLKGYNND